jgi:hypothetical protein
MKIIEKKNLFSLYLVTTGWLNWPLEMLKFWPWLESIVEKYTGAKPRSDDFAWAQKTEKVHYY